METIATLALVLVPVAMTAAIYIYIEYYRNTVRMPVLAIDGLKAVATILRKYAESTKGQLDDKAVDLLLYAIVLLENEATDHD